MCMLRYNASTVLKLYAIARHIQPPGGMIFSTDDLILQLNQTENAQTVKPVHPLKHPKMIKKPLNREKIANEIVVPLKTDSAADIISNAIPPLDDTDIRKKAMFIPSGNMFNEESGPSESGGYPNPNAIFEQEQQQQNVNPEDYENYFNYDLQRKFPMRSKYPTNRDVRSKMDINGKRKIK